MIGKTDFDLYPAEQAQKFFEIESRILQSGEPAIDADECVFDVAGNRRWLSTSKVPLRNRRNGIAGLIGISRDITERSLGDVFRDGQAKMLEMIAENLPLEQAIAELITLIESHLAEIVGSVFIADDRGARWLRCVAPNLPAGLLKAFEALRFGSSAEAFRTRLDKRQALYEPKIVTGDSFEEFRAIAGEHGYLSCWTFPFFSYEGALLGAFSLYAKTVRPLSDVELRLADIAIRIARIAIERKAAETRIHFLATHDALTGLANRSLLQDRLAQAILYAQRYDRTVAVVFLDLDNFKLVNDSLGHGAGDDLLKEIATRLADSVRNSDTVVRLGGDEFVIVLLDQQENANSVSVTLQKLRAAIARPLRLQERKVQVTCSIGVAQYPDDGEDGDTLLANADAAMYRAKEIGRDNFQFYTPELNKRVHEKFILLGELRSAVARCEFILHYQPKVDLRTGHVFGLEALVRWMHPTLGLVPPADFIPLAEETGLIVQIGDWVLREACRQSKAWQDAGLPCLTVSVNVSPRQFTDADLIERVTAALTSAGLEAKYLELEMTESLVMQNVGEAVAKMKQLQALGLQFAIDDFGIGYSNLSALKAFPIARLKIDKSFIVDLSNNENDRAVASAVISLGQKLNLRVVAEGVETEEQMVFLRDNNCDEMQGFHFSKPLSVEDVESFLLSHISQNDSSI